MTKRRDLNIRIWRTKNYSRYAITELSEDLNIQKLLPICNYQTFRGLEHLKITVCYFSILRGLEHSNAKNDETKLETKDFFSDRIKENCSTAKTVTTLKKIIGWIETMVQEKQLLHSKKTRRAYVNKSTICSAATEKQRELHERCFRELCEKILSLFIYLF